jgi:hypothetical protein
MARAPQPAPVAKASLWTGRIITVLLALFLVFDGVTKLMKVPQVISATQRLGFPLSAITGIAITLLICTALYLIPQTAILGAVLLTGYLGGAVAITLRAGTPAFETAFPAIFGVLVWLGIYLRENRLHSLLPLRK